MEGNFKQEIYSLEYSYRVSLKTRANLKIKPSKYFQDALNIRQNAKIISCIKINSTPKVRC